MPRDPREACSDCGVVYGALAYEDAMGSVRTVSRSEREIVNKTLDSLAAPPVKRARLAAFRQEDEEANGNSSGKYVWSCCNFCVRAVDTEGLYDLEE